MQTVTSLRILLLPALGYEAIMIKTNNAKILVVDDDATQIQTVISHLQSMNYDLFIAKNRSDTLKTLANNDIDLVLLDINLPDGNGFEICREIRSQHEFNDNLSIVFMTSHHSNEREAEGLSVGANDYIYKPLNQQVLVARINVQLQQLRKTKLLSHYANVDALTELGNRRAFDEQLQQELKRGEREGVPVSLLSMDIDFFKAYNDHYGHPQGDKCLREVANCIKSECRRPSDFAFRVGGEEFAIVLYNTPASGAMLFADKIRSKLATTALQHEFSSVSEFVTMSIGVTDTLSASYNIVELIAQADEMLYQAKEGGRNQAIAHDWLAVI